MTVPLEFLTLSIVLTEHLTTDQSRQHWFSHLSTGSQGGFCSSVLAPISHDSLYLPVYLSKY